MKIQLLSDTHGSPYTLHPEADVIAHAGDFGNGLAAMRQFQAACNEAGKPYVFVLGNHDYYHENMSDVCLQLRDEPCLRAGKTVQIDGRTFVGDTLFSNFRQHQVSTEQFEQNCNLAQVSVADFTYILITCPTAKTSGASRPRTMSACTTKSGHGFGSFAGRPTPSSRPISHPMQPAPPHSLPNRRSIPISSTMWI